MWACQARLGLSRVVAAAAMVVVMALPCLNISWLEKWSSGLINDWLNPCLIHCSYEYGCIDQLIEWPIQANNHAWSVSPSILPSSLQHTHALTLSAIHQVNDQLMCVWTNKCIPFLLSPHDYLQQNMVATWIARSLLLGDAEFSPTHIDLTYFEKLKESELLQGLMVSVGFLWRA